MAWVNAIIQGVLIGGLYALFACGLSLMFGVMKVVNLAHGDLAVVAGYVAIGVITVTHIPVLLSFLIVVPLMALLGYVLQRTILQGALDRSVLTTLMVTFGLSVVIENGLLQFFTANSRAIGTGLALVTGSFTLGSQIQIGYLPVVIFVVAVVVLLGLQYFLSASRYGRLIRAVAIGYPARRGRESVPNGRCPAVLGDRAFDLVCRGGGAPQEVRREDQVGRGEKYLVAGHALMAPSMMPPMIWRPKTMKTISSAVPTIDTTVLTNHRFSLRSSESAASDAE